MAGNETHRTSRQIDDLADSFVSGRLSRRAFVVQMLAMGLTTSAAGSILAASTAAAGSAPAKGLKGTVRFLIGPWSDDEDKHQQVIASAFKALNPDVNITFKLWDWEQSDLETTNSLASGAHDIYYLEESHYAQRLAQTEAGFEDIAPRINDPAWAEEKAKYLYWDHFEQYGTKMIGLPFCANLEDVLYVNMDMVKEAGFDETFVDSWDSFEACVRKMTKPDVYGLGLGIQIGPTYGEWYQFLRAAGGSYLTPDLKEPNINKPEVVEITKRIRKLYDDNVIPAYQSYNPDTGADAFVAKRMATYGCDFGSVGILTPHLPLSFDWKLMAYPPGASGKRFMFGDVACYAMSSKSPDKDLVWEALKWWTNGQSGGYWNAVTGTLPCRTDAGAAGFDSSAEPHIIEASKTLPQFGGSQEPFAKWGACEPEVETQIGRCWAGELSPEDAIASAEKAIRQVVFGS